MSRMVVIRKNDIVRFQGCTLRDDILSYEALGYYARLTALIEIGTPQENLPIENSLVDELIEKNYAEKRTDPDGKKFLVMYVRRPDRKYVMALD